MMRSKEQTTTPAPAERGLTFRSVGLGLGIVVFINLWVTYAETVVHSSRLNLSYFQLTLMAVFLILVAVVNPFLKMCSPRIAFSPSELLAIVAIGMVGLRSARLWHHGLFNRSDCNPDLFFHAGKSVGGILSSASKFMGGANTTRSTPHIL